MYLSDIWERTLNLIMMCPWSHCHVWSLFCCWFRFSGLWNYFFYGENISDYLSANGLPSEEVESSEVLYNLERPISCVQLFWCLTQPFIERQAHGMVVKVMELHEKSKTWHALALCQSKWQWATVVLAIAPLPWSTLSWQPGILPHLQTQSTLALFRAAILA